MSKALKQTTSGLYQQHEFATALQRFQEQVLKDMKASNREAQSIIARLTNSFDMSLQKVLQKLSSSVKTTQVEVSKLSSVSLGV